MKKLQKIKKSKPNVLNTSLKYLVVAIASVATMPVAQADVNNKGIGDLEIYQPASSGKITITMMLDTSSSMIVDSSTRNREACELPPLSNFDQKPAPVVTEDATADRPYTRTYCAVSTSTDQKIYSYVLSGGNYYNCDSTDKCEELIPATRYRTPPSISGLKRESFTRKSGSTAFRYYKLQTNTTTTKHYDRLTRLKDAIFTLMDAKDENGNYALDPTNISIGIGQFSSQTKSDNTTKLETRQPVTMRVSNSDNSSGKIVVPAALLDDAQRQKIKDAVAKMWGAGTTPSAAAYAEAGAYMLGTTTKLDGENYGFDYSVMTNDLTSRNANNYISPLADNAPSCDGQGIYFLTDGEPNSAKNPEKIMAKALGSHRYEDKGNHVITAQGTQSDVAGIMEIANFSRLLRDASSNPKNRSIRTAVVGFGSIFDISKYQNIARELPAPEIDVSTGLYIPNRFKENQTAKYFDCSLIEKVDARNACNWGAKSHPQFEKEGKKVGGYGEGGFYYAQSSQDVIDSVKTFLGDLSNAIEPVPAGVIVVPDDPYSLNSKQAVAYYPTVEARVAESPSIWAGNMKKYALKDGTLYGKSNTKLFKDLAGNLNPTAQDLWSDKDYAGKNSAVTAGGFYAQLRTPTSDLGSVRKLYIQDGNTLKTFGVNSQGKVTVNNSQITASSLTDTATYTQAVKRRLLNFLGYTDDDIPEGDVETITLKKPTEDIKVLGASIHSSPAVVSHGADLDDRGQVDNTKARNDHVLFGSMDGALHLVKTNDYGKNNGGQEEFAFIPKEMLTDAQNLQGLSTSGKGKAVGVPNFGIDAPWLVTADYKYDFDDGKVKVDSSTDGIGIYAYGGLRMGGKAFYGLNLADISSPKLAFSITPESNDFSRMGQIWAKPVRAKIRTSTTDKKGTDVLVFGGGYDMCYENEKFQVGVTDPTLGSCSGKTEAEGNALYIINAKTGRLIWSASSSGGNKRDPNLKHSIVGGVTVLDRDNDGFMDHIYFADLGGQVFRADFKNAGLKVGEDTASSFENARIVKLLDNASSGDAQKFNRRFYEKPIVSVYRNPTTNRLFGLINVVSGDRSSPLSKIRTTTENSDRLYGLIDNDVSLPANNIYSKTFVGSFANPITDANLVNIPAKLASKGSIPYSQTVKNEVINLMKNGKDGSTNIQGWYYPLTRFDGYNNVLYTKGVGVSTVIGSILYTTMYNPDKDHNTVTDACTAKIAGGSERQLYCLPYGICLDDTSATGTGGYIPAGRGIQELTLGPVSAEEPNKTVLIGNQTMQEQVKNTTGYGQDSSKDTQLEKTQKQSNPHITQVGGDGSAAMYLFNERFQLKPKTWYEIN